MNNDICKETGAYMRNSLEGHFFDKSLGEAICDTLTKHSISSVYDFGCGHGEYTKIIKDNNFDCSGFDANPFTNNITNGLCEVLNLAEPVDLPEVDCVLCLEMGEHVPKKFEDIVINNIDQSASKLVIISWAIEGQVGEGHVNCRNNDYIKQIFQTLGYDNLVAEETTLRTSSTLSWFKNTIMVFKK